MLLVRATLQVYRDAGLDAVRATARSAWALILLLLLFPLLTVASLALSPLGVAGGFVVGLLNAACAGTYLATLQDALDERRSLSLSAIRQNLGRYTFDVIGVAFPIWIASMIVGFLIPPAVSWIFPLAVGVVFNVAPEHIGRSRSAGVEVLRESAYWLKDNAPEWFVPQLFLVIPLLAMRPSSAGTILSMFGPLFGFVNAGALAIGAGAGPIGWAIGLALVAFVHATMLFRGALYQRLGRGGRRQRAWKARLGE